MTIVRTTHSLLFFVTMIALSACNPLPGQTVPAAFVLVNGKTGPETITITQSPISLVARTNKTGSGSMEFFDGATSIGTVTAGAKRSDGSEGYDFALSATLTSANNGQRTYKATFVGKDLSGQALQFVSQSTTVTVAVP